MAAFLLHRAWIATAGLAVLRVIAANAQASPPQVAAPLTIEEVVKQSQNGISEELIVTRIKKNGRVFDLSTEELLELKKAGVSDTIIKFLLDPSPAYTPPVALPQAQPAPPPNPPPPIAPAKKYPNDPLASR